MELKFLKHIWYQVCIYGIKYVYDMYQVCIYGMYQVCIKYVYTV